MEGNDLVKKLSEQGLETRNMLRQNFTNIGQDEWDLIFNSDFTLILHENSDELKKLAEGVEHFLNLLKYKFRRIMYEDMITTSPEGKELRILFKLMGSKLIGLTWKHKRPDLILYHHEPEENYRRFLYSAGSNDCIYHGFGHPRATHTKDSLVSKY